MRIGFTGRYSGNASMKIQALAFILMLALPRKSLYKDKYAYLTTPNACDGSRKTVGDA